MNLFILEVEAFKMSVLDRLNAVDQMRANEREAEKQRKEQEQQRLAQILQNLTNDQGFMEAAADEVIESFIQAYENHRGFGELKKHWFSLRPRFGRDFLNGADSRLDDLTQTHQQALTEAIARLVSEKIAGAEREAICIKDGGDKILINRLDSESEEEFKMRLKHLQEEESTAREKWPWIIVIRPKKT
jgi:hypothetical protein